MLVERVALHFQTPPDAYRLRYDPVAQERYGLIPIPPQLDVTRRTRLPLRLVRLIVAVEYRLHDEYPLKTAVRRHPHIGS
jgi:hypothetical protein